MNTSSNPEPPLNRNVPSANEKAAGKNNHSLRMPECDKKNVCFGNFLEMP
jgi:hypothetical protein